MQIDRFGTSLATPSQEAARHVEDATLRLLAHRPNADCALGQAGDADPDCIGAHALRGLCQVMMARAETVGLARRHLSRAESAQMRAPGTECETSLVKALRFGVHGGLRAAAEICEIHLRAKPDAVLFAKLAHVLRFMSGDQAALRSGVDLTLSALPREAPGYGYLLGCRAFALEECGDFPSAERLGREAVDLEPMDAWATHAVGHVLEMTGRAGEGLSWIQSRRPHWKDCNNFALHMSWHAALFHLELGAADAALELYDEDIWPRATDDFRDLANSISLLARLDALDVPVGDRWHALAEVACSRRHDVTCCFASLHYLLALLAAGQIEQAGDLVRAMERPALPGNDQERVLRHAARPLAQLLYETACGRSRRFDPEALLAAVGTIGGSHAQRDVFLISLSNLALSVADTAALTAILAFRRQLKVQDRFETLFRSRLRRDTQPIRYSA